MEPYNLYYPPEHRENCADCCHVGECDWTLGMCKSYAREDNADEEYERRNDY